MMEQPQATITTILFTDLVSSTDLMQRVGDESAQRIFQAHHQLLADAVAQTGGDALQWLGDGLMAAFASTGDAVRCAVHMQQAAAQQVGAERLQIRVGLNAGEILRQATGSGYFGTPVVVSRRLCDRAQAGQILSTGTVAGLLAGRQAFRFRPLGEWELKGMAAPVSVCEVLYDTKDALGALAKTPFVGRGAEIERLRRRLAQAKSGSGSFVLLAGEPGIGKTRMAEELAEEARRDGVRILWGRCFEGDTTQPYGPFAEAFARYGKDTDAAELQTDLGPYGRALARMAPVIGQRVPDLPALVDLQAEDERWRLFDGVVQFLGNIGARAPLLLVLDDLHWADGGTIALVRHVAHSILQTRMMMLGLYRDVELDRTHPLGESLATLRRERNCERIALRGLDSEEVSELLGAMAAHDVPPALVDAINRETDGNPFFIREIVLHLIEDGKVYREGGRWTSHLSIDELGIPEGVRQVIGRRLSRLSEPANKLLGAASGTNGAFCFEVAWRVAGLVEAVALDGLDEALDAQLIRSTGTADTYEFVHALVRHTLYTELNSSRQVRLHRRIAETMEEVYGNRAAEHAGEIAEQYYRSAALPGAERGVRHCLAAAAQAEQAAAFEDAASALRMALELLPVNDAGRPRLLARLGLALAWALADEEAASVASDAAEALAASEGSGAAAHYLADAVDALWTARYRLAPLAPLVAQALRHVGTRRDLVWARLMIREMMLRAAGDPDDPGIPLDSPERRETARVIWEHWDEAVQIVMKCGDFFLLWNSFESRNHVLQRAAAVAPVLIFFAGEYLGTLAPARAIAEVALQQGAIQFAALGLTAVARVETALGELVAAEETFAHAETLARRVPLSPFSRLQLAAFTIGQAMAREEGFEAELRVIEELLAEAAVENRWVMATWRAAGAAICAHLGRGEEARRRLLPTLPAIERGPGWAVNYTILIWLAVDTIWTLGVTDHAGLFERNLREKTLAPDFRYPNTDARLALARLSALQGRYEEAVEWFPKARAVLEEQGARPLRAITDFDEALMYVRRGAAGDHERALPLLDAALSDFEAIGMPGWVRRARQLRRQSQ